MKAFVAAVIVAVVVAIGASFVLEAQQKSVDQAFATNSTRVGEPGHNLIVVD
jgi:hypothetical protein